MTIEELASATGLSVRNVRNHQTRGILPGPQMHGRVGYYGHEHVNRLRLIRRLQKDGHSLKAIESLLMTRGDTADRMNALRAYALSQFPHSGAPERVTLEQARERFGDYDARAIELALALNAVSLDEGAFLVQDPALLALLERATSQGLTLSGTLEAAGVVQRLCDQAAAAFVDLIRRDLWAPFTDAGHPEERWEQLTTAIDEVRPLAGQIFLLMLPEAMGLEIERVFGEEISRQADAAAQLRRASEVGC